MHHSLRFYSGHRPGFLKFYLFWARWTKTPLVGWLVKQVANTYGDRMHRAYLLTPAEANNLLDIAEGVALGRCDCRAVFKNCNNPVDAEILLGPTRHTFLEALSPDYHEITRETAKDILRECHNRGLLHTIIRCRGDFYAICSCCACCCVPLRLSKQYGIGSALTRHVDIVQAFKDFQLAFRA